MKLREIRIKNFRCLADIVMPVADTTILVGENNSGKTALLQALRFALPWRANTGRTSPFDEYDYFMKSEDDSPTSGDGITLELWFKEDTSDEWPESLTQALDNMVQTDPDSDTDSIGLRLSSKYDENTKEIINRWEFLNTNGQPLGGKGARPNNLPQFLSYIRCFYLTSLRDSNSEFSPRSSFWGRILKDLNISEEQKKIFNEQLSKLNEDLLKADARLGEVRETLEKGQKLMEPGTGQKTSIHALPLKPWDLMSKAEVVIKSRGSDVDFPLYRHGQGMQSLSVLFLFQAYIDVLLKPTFQPETEAILTLEEPEAHLHPQTIRALAANLNQISSQKIISTHSPYFIQEIPLENIRMFRRKGPSSKILSIKRFFTAKIPQSPELEAFCSANSEKFSYDTGKTLLTLKGKMEEEKFRRLIKIYREQAEVHSEIRRLKNESGLYLSDEELTNLQIYT